MVTTSPSLLERMRNDRDHGSWRRFLELYTPVIDDWVSRLPVGASDRDDIVQEIMFRVVRKVGDFRRDRTGSFRRWLKTITLNQCRDYLRRQRPDVSQNWQGFDELPGREVLECFDEAEYRCRLAQRALQLMQNDFQETTWRACWKSVVEGQSARQIAADLGITVNAVYVAKSRVLGRLRVELQGFWDEGVD